MDLSNARIGIVCNRVDDVGVPTVEGAVKSACGTCANEVWLSPSSVEVQKNNPGAEVRCWRCAIDSGEFANANVIVTKERDEQTEKNTGKKMSDFLREVGVKVSERT